MMRYLFGVALMIALLMTPLAISNAATNEMGRTQIATISLVQAIAREWFYRFRDGNIDRSQLDVATNGELSEPSMEKESGVLKSFGALQSMSFLDSGIVIGDVVGYDFRLHFASGMIIESIAFDPDGKIAGIDFRPYYRST